MANRNPFSPGYVPYSHQYRDADSTGEIQFRDSVLPSNTNSAADRSFDYSISSGSEETVIPSKSALMDIPASQFMREMETQKGVHSKVGKSDTISE